MAKLVEVLARELKAWPEDCVSVTQDESGDVYVWVMDGAEYRGFSWYSPENKDCGMTDMGMVSLDQASDYDNAIVTRDMWQSERDRQKGGEWKRHRGGKQPVDGTEYVEVRLRDGDIQKSYARCFAWPYSACDHYANIMAFRVLEKPEQEEKEVERKGESVSLEYQICGEGEEPKPDAWQTIGGNPQNIGTITYIVDLNTEPAMQKIEELQAKWDQFDGPLKWRDLIIELEAHAEDIEREISKLFGKLSAEGFQLIRQRPMTPVAEVDQVDMQDWRNWEAGDIISSLANYEGEFSCGSLYEVTDCKGGHVEILADDSGYPNGWNANKFKFFQRP